MSNVIKLCIHCRSSIHTGMLDVNVKDNTNSDVAQPRCKLCIKWSCQEIQYVSRTCNEIHLISAQTCTSVIDLLRYIFNSPCWPSHPFHWMENNPNEERSRIIQITWCSSFISFYWRRLQKLWHSKVKNSSVRLQLGKCHCSDRRLDSLDGQFEYSNMYFVPINTAEVLRLI